MLMECDTTKISIKEDDRESRLQYISFPYKP